MKIEVHNRCSDFNSYRAARVKSLFNAETGANFDLAADLPIDDPAWSLGVIVGPSGSGKTSMGRQLWGAEYLDGFDNWPGDRPIIDAIAPGGDFNDVTGALASVGLGDVPAWLRPYSVLSNGEKFRANLARVLCERPERIVIDEFSSVVDRQIARMGALAFAKAWKRQAKETGAQAVLLSCHYDILEWLELEPHHYLKMPKMVAARCFVGMVDGELVSHLAVSPKLDIKGVRACRMVVMPELDCFTGSLEPSPSAVGTLLPRAASGRDGRRL